MMKQTFEKEKQKHFNDFTYKYKYCPNCLIGTDYTMKMGFRMNIFDEYGVFVGKCICKNCGFYHDRIKRISIKDIRKQKLKRILCE